MEAMVSSVGLTQPFPPSTSSSLAPVALTAKAKPTQPRLVSLDWMP